MPDLYAVLKILHALGWCFMVQHLIDMLKKEVCPYPDSLQMAIHLAHEVFNGQPGRVILKAEGLGHFFLVLKVELVIFAATDIMQPVADTHQVVLCLFQFLEFCSG